MGGGGSKGRGKSGKKEVVLLFFDALVFLLGFLYRRYSYVLLSFSTVEWQHRLHLSL